MAFSAPFTAVAGATITAASHNTGYRDNLNAIWVGTTAGDMDYYGSATTKTRLAGGGDGAILYNLGAATPSWLAAGGAGTFLYNAPGSYRPSWLAAGGAGTIMYNSASTTPAWLAKGASAYIPLRMNSAATLPEWGWNGQFYARQGGSSTVWNTAGTSNYVPANSYSQGGVCRMSYGGGTGAQTIVTFPYAFAYVPLVFVSVVYDTTSADQTALGAKDLTASGFTAYGNVASGDAGVTDVAWLAIGPL